MNGRSSKLIRLSCGVCFALSFCFPVANAQAGRQRPPSAEAIYPVGAPPQTRTSEASQTGRGAVDPATRPSLLTCRCLEREGEFERVDEKIDAAPEEPIYRRRELSTPAVILSKPDPRYTESARRHSTSGVVLLRVVLAATGRVSRVEVLKGLPDGLTENAVSAACRVKFKPALKDDQAVSQAVMLEYGFRVFGSPPPPILSRPPLRPRF